MRRTLRTRAKERTSHRPRRASSPQPRTSSPQPRASRRSVLGVAAALVAACGTAPGCGDDDVAGPGPTDVDALRDPPQWELLRIEGPDGTVEPVTGPRGVPSLVFTGEDVDGEGKRVVGDTGCNQGGGAYVARDDGSLEFRDLAWTEMACLEPGVMDIEQAFQDAMSTVRAFLLESSARLVVRFDGGEMVFEALREDDEAT